MAFALGACLISGSVQAEMVYRVATMGEPKTLDPHGVSGTWENYIVGDAFMGLLTDAADAKPIPGAAESWTISDDGLTYTFKIRDHKWSDGDAGHRRRLRLLAGGASSTRRRRPNMPRSCTR